MRTLELDPRHLPALLDHALPRRRWDAEACARRDVSDSANVQEGLCEDGGDGGRGCAEAGFKGGRRSGAGFRV